MRRRKTGDGSVRLDERVAEGGPNQPSGSLSNHVLNLQRDYGNAAVTTVVQRKGGKAGKASKAASTDAPGYKKKKVEKKAAEADFAPKEMGEATKGREVGWLINQGNTYKASGESSKTPAGRKAMFDRAAGYYLGVMWISPTPGNAQYLTNLYKVSGDKARYDYWMKVQTKQIVLPAHKAGEEAVEDQTGKEF